MITIEMNEITAFLDQTEKVCEALINCAIHYWPDEEINVCGACYEEAECEADIPHKVDCAFKLAEALLGRK